MSTDRYAEKSRRQMVLDSVHDAVVDMLDYNADDDPELLERYGVENALRDGDVTIEDMAAALADAIREQLGLAEGETR